MAQSVVYVGFSTVMRSQPPWTLTDVELVKQDLLNTFNTRRGERIMRPEYGTRIFDLLMDPFDDQTRQAIIEDVERVIREEPRAQLTDIQVGELNHVIRVEAQLNFQPQDSTELLVIEYDRRNQATP